MAKIRKSDWKFETSQGVAGQVAVIVAVGAGEGSITLTDPRGSKIRFGYLSAGVGGGLGGKVNLGYSTEDFPSSGEIFMTQAFSGKELEIKDLVGPCVITEVSIAVGGPKGASVGAGGALTAMFLGIPPDKLQLQALVSAPGLIPLVLREFGIIDIPSYAKAVLVMKGGTQGWGAGIGALQSFGYVWAGGVRPKDMLGEVTYDGPSRIGSPVDPPRISIPDDVLFGFDKFFIKPTAHEDLHAAGQWMLKYPGRPVLIKGHTDSVGNVAYNKWLSEQRAVAVKQWLISHGYAKGTSVSTQGLGESEPAMPNNTEKGRAKNRRVEIIFLPFPKPVKWF